MQQNVPSISVVIAAYNCAPWITDVINDVLKQTYSDLELIVVDDGSKDATAEVVQKIKDPRLRYIWQEGSGSPAKPRNHGLAVARGKYITFLDHDDRWVSRRVEKVMSCFKGDPKVDVVCHDEWIVSNGKRLRKIQCGPGSQNLYLDMLTKGNRLATSAVTLRTECVRKLGGFNEERAMFTVEDFDLWLRLARAGYNFYFLNELLGDYTLHNANMTGNRAAHHEAKRRLALRHIDENPDLLGLFQRQILAQCDLALARDFHLRGDFNTALSRYFESWNGGNHSIKLCVGALLAAFRVRA